MGWAKPSWQIWVDLIKKKKTKKTVGHWQMTQIEQEKVLYSAG